MELELKDIKQAFDKDYVHGQATREKASDDLVFYYVTHWDNQLIQETPLKFRGQFDMLRKAGRDILATLAANPISIKYNPKGIASDDDSQFLSGMYLTDNYTNPSLEAKKNATNETVVCGVGAWELYTEYDSLRSDDDKQVIKRRMITEACNTVFWDANAKSIDKHDAMRVSILFGYSEDGYKELVHELTGEEIEDINTSNFAEPEQSYAFPWVGSGEDTQYHVVKQYRRYKVKDKLLTFVDPIGDTRELLESDIESVEDELADYGFELITSKEIDRYEVKMYIASGERILSEEIIACEHIPVIPMYGEYAHIEGQPHYEGMTRLAKDPQRLRNFQLSYLSSIVGTSPRRKPIFAAEQIRGFEHMYEDSGADNDYPYLYQNLYDDNGQQLPIGPVGELPDQQIPSALAASIPLTEKAIEDVANPALPQNIADPDLSGKAVIALQNQINKQTMIYQEHLKHAERRDAEVYASFASNIIDTPRDIRLTKPDGTVVNAQAMEIIVDRDTGEPVTINDITNKEFDVSADIAPSYSNQVDATIDQINDTMAQLTPDNKFYDMLLLKKLLLMPGVDTDDIREQVRKEQLIKGYREPETPEEEELLQQIQAAQQNQVDPAMQLAQAEMMKGQADLIQAQNDQAKLAADMQSDRQNLLVKAYDSETKRMQADTQAKKAEADTRLKAREQIFNRVSKQQDSLRVRLN